MIAEYWEVEIRPDNLPHFFNAIFDRLCFDVFLLTKYKHLRKGQKFTFWAEQECMTRWWGQGRRISQIATGFLENTPECN